MIMGIKVSILSSLRYDYRKFKMTIKQDELIVGTEIRTVDFRLNKES